jgi:hypothetical protein
MKFCQLFQRLQLRSRDSFPYLMTRVLRRRAQRSSFAFLLATLRTAHSLDVSELGVPPSESDEGVWITSTRMSPAALYKKGVLIKFI